MSTVDPTQLYSECVSLKESFYLTNSDVRRPTPTTTNHQNPAQSGEIVYDNNVSHDEDRPNVRGYIRPVEESGVTPSPKSSRQSWIRLCLEATCNLCSQLIQALNDGRPLKPVVQVFTSSYGSGAVLPSHTCMQQVEQPVAQVQCPAVNQESNTTSTAKTRVALGFKSYTVLELARVLRRPRLLPVRAVDVLFVAGPHLFRTRVTETQDGMKVQYPPRKT